jgi:HAD superfamily hydrolase (TIGR01490 family)
MAAPRIAFFDLDRTLICRNSATLWIRFELAAGRITPWQAVTAAAWVLRYSLGAADMSDTVRRGVRVLRGRAEAEMRTRVKEFHQSRLRPLYRPGAFPALRRHRDAGDRLVLLTSSSNYVSEEVCRDLELDDHLCNRFETDGNGIYTGRALEPICFGAGKVLLARDYAERIGADLAECFFYTDSLSDLPMLEAVGRPVAVHPDPRLRRLARRRGWATAQWGRP